MPFRMRKPAHQASFYRVLVKLLLYLMSGSSKVGHVNMDDWNPLCGKAYGKGRNVLTLSLPLSMIPRKTSN